MDELGRPLAVPFFFFGTLLDVDVLARGLDRSVAERELEPAMLWGFRRHRVREASYPVLRQHRDSHVNGRLFRPSSWDERCRIEHFESDEYRADVVRVQAGTRMIDAFCFMDLDGVFDVEDADWSLNYFRSTGKTVYLADCERWMAGYVALT
jgi:hypothetical protein